jgi:sulfatase maturation enzyme AslB (radical SAM superfamily)
MPLPDVTGPAPGASAGQLPRCLVFPDGDDWIVFGPRSLLALRVNAEAAARFRDLPDPGPAGPKPRSLPDPEDFVPSCVTITCTNQCGQRCAYCYGTPAHRNRAVLDLDFCRSALELVASRALARGETVRIIFHGVGEPTFAWKTFTACVETARAVTRRLDVIAHLDLCTGGQVTAKRAEWIATHFDSVQVSIDGPADIHNRQRPRADGRDSLAGPLRLARAVKAATKRLSVKTTVTAATVGRMVEIVDFVASEIGRTRLDLGMMFALPWVRPDSAAPPEWMEFVTGFGEALDRGAELGVRVQDPCISWEALAAEQGSRAARHFCLAPPNVVTSFFDVPEEGSATPQLGAYGWYDSSRNTIAFDHEKRLRLEEEQTSPACQQCACRASCLGQGGVKGRMPKEIEVLGPVCQARIGVLKELLRRAVARHPAPPSMGREEVLA